MQNTERVWDEAGEGRREQRAEHPHWNQRRTKDHVTGLKDADKMQG